MSPPVLDYQLPWEHHHDGPSTLVLSDGIPTIKTMLKHLVESMARFEVRVDDCD